MTRPDEPQTPRTDAVAGDGWSGDAECVSADFARQLELELRGSRRIIDEMGVENARLAEACKQARDMLMNAGLTQCALAVDAAIKP